MDIDLLSKMIKELILDTDEVILPGVGTFVAEIVPSTFSDKGYTINPPYRRLSFRQRQTEGSTMISDFYASSNNLDRQSAEMIIGDFMKELKEVLQKRKMIIFPGLGRLRATRENTFFFVADEDLDIYPAGFGLEPVSLKSHNESPETVSAALASLKTIIAEPEEAVADTVMEPEQEAAEPIESVPAEAEVQTETTQEVTETPAEAETSAEAPEEETTPEGPEIPSEEETVPVDVETAPAEIEEVPAEIKETAEEDESLVPGIGIEISEEAEHETTEGSLKTTEDTPKTTTDTEEEFESVSEEGASEQSEPAPRPKPEPIVGKNAADYIHYETEESKGRTILKVVIAIVATIAVLLIAYVILSRVAPGLFDSLLYSKEELEVLRF